MYEDGAHELEPLLEYLDDPASYLEEAKAPTYSSDNPRKRGDYLFVSKDIKVESYRTNQTLASNHLPIITSMSIPKSDNDVPLPEPPVDEDSIAMRVGCYNIQAGFGMDGACMISRTADVIKSFNADVIALNEVDKETSRSGNIDQAKFIAEKLHYNYVFGKSIDFRGGEYGNAILSRYPIVSSKTHMLPTGDLQVKEARSLLECQIDVEGEIINILATHLGLTEEERDISIGYIKDVVADLDGPIVLMGDFNMIYEESTNKFEPLLEYLDDPASYLGEEAKAPTFPSDNPNRKIDYIFISKDIEAKASKVIQTKASDHLPITADIIIPKSDSKDPVEPVEPETPESVTEVINLIDALPKVDDLKLTDKEAVQAARTAYNALTSEEKEKVTNLETLENAEAFIKELEKELGDPKPEIPESVTKVIDLINALPEVENLKLADKEDVKAARDAYELLSTEEKEKVTNLEILENAEACIEELEKELGDPKLETPESVTKVINLIAALPKADDLKLTHKKDVEAARKAYNALTSEEKKLVTNVDILKKAETRILELEKELKKTNKPKKDQSKLPKTGMVETKAVWIGLIIVLAGVSLFIFAQKKNKSRYVR